MKNYCIIKKVFIFAASDQDRFFGMICGSYFYGYTDAAYHKDIRLSIHNGLLHSCFNRSWSRCGKIAFPLLYTLIFHSMTKTNENASRVNNSSSHAREACESGVSVATIQLQVSNPYSIACFDDFIAEATRRFEVEKNEKNRLYSFLISQGLLDVYAEFIRYNKSDDWHDTCLRQLELSVTEKD